MDYDTLLDNGLLFNTMYEGTCQLWEYDNVRYVVLCDNTIITHEEDLANDPIFPD